jgi:hypothetical protein
MGGSSPLMIIVDLLYAPMRWSFIRTRIAIGDLFYSDAALIR